LIFQDIQTYGTSDGRYIGMPYFCYKTYLHKIKMLYNTKLLTICARTNYILFIMIEL